MPQILPMYIYLILTIMIISIMVMISTNELSWKNQKKIKDNKTFSSKNKFFLSLFISFDPQSTMFTEMNWIILILVTSMFILSMWTKPTRMNIILDNINEEITNQFKIALKSKKDSSKGIFISLFFLILSVNMMGMFPNIFTPTSHITLNLLMALPMWVGFTLFGWSTYTNKMFSHLVPSGTPIPLISFMVLIELISNIIRPLTLSIRLMANMISGHLLLTLMGNLMNSMPIKMILILTLVQSILTTLELGVAFIQAYVFCMLLTLYSDDSDMSDH